MCPPKPSPVSWQPAPQTLIITPGEIHLWQMWLDVGPVQLRALHEYLSGGEKTRGEQFRDRKDGERYVAAHGSLRTILSRYLHTEPAKLTFHQNEYGKPFLSPSGSEDLRFNMSRSDEISLIAITRGRDVGVDIEHILPIPEQMQIAEQFFCPEERSFLMALDVEEQQEAFFRLWTMKEAFVKGRGQGLSIPLNRFEVCFQDGKPVLHSPSDSTGIDVHGWSLVEPNPHPDYAAALAVEGQIGSVRHWRLGHPE